jgi:AdoMet-dependent rRNA methyltransferase SPB1
MENITLIKKTMLLLLPNVKIRNSFLIILAKMKKSPFFNRKIFKEGFKTENPEDLPTIVNPIKLGRLKTQKNEADKMAIEEAKPKVDKKTKESDSEDDKPIEDDFVRIKGSNKLKDKRKKKLVDHAKKLSDLQDEWQDVNKHGARTAQEIEIVPEIRYEDYDLDNLAEMRVLAKKMLRQKDRDQIIDDSYNRYTTPVDEDAPEWFLEDERRHVYKHIPITKEEYQQEKDMLLALQNKPIKKVKNNFHK